MHRAYKSILQHFDQQRDYVRKKAVVKGSAGEMYGAQLYSLVLMDT